MLKDYLTWPYAEQIFRLGRHFVRLVDGKEMREVSYGVTSLTREEAGADQLLQLSRSHWGSRISSAIVAMTPYGKIAVD